MSSTPRRGAPDVLFQWLLTLVPTPFLSRRLPSWYFNFASHVESGGRPDTFELPQGILPPCLLPHGGQGNGGDLTHLTVCFSEEDDDAGRTGSYVVLFTGVVVDGVDGTKMDFSW